MDINKIIEKKLPNKNNSITIFIYVMVEVLCEGSYIKKSRVDYIIHYIFKNFVCYMNYLLINTNHLSTSVSFCQIVF